MNENKTRKGSEMTNLSVAIEAYLAKAGVSNDSEFTAKNTSFFGGEVIERTYKVAEMVGFISRQPKEAVEAAIVVLGQLTEANDLRYDNAYWQNVANAMLGVENATEETGVNL